MSSVIIKENWSLLVAIASLTSRLTWLGDKLICLYIMLPHLMIPANADTVRRTFSSFVGIISSPERNLLAPIVAMMVHAILPIGTPKIID